MMKIAERFHAVIRDARCGAWRMRRRASLFVILLAVVLLTLRLLPKPALHDFAPTSSAVYAADGTLLRLTLARDEQFRLWTPLAAISPKMVEAVKRYEDRWFDWHPGVNPGAVVRSAFGTFFGARRLGGSTLTMQLARKIYAIDSRNISGKLTQMVAALWLEARYSKADILEAYLNLAPYGGNVEGVGAASLVYFHKRAEALTLPEALTLAVIPQNPAARGGSKADSPATAAARARLAARWLAAHPDDEKLGLKHAIAPKSAPSLPFGAPHGVNQVLGMHPPGREIFTSLDRKMQQSMERAITQFIARRNAEGIRNAAAILLDADSMEVKALVGSARFHDDEIDGQVNGTLAKRSPGSTLKPFIYALAFDQGVLHPMTVLKDAPTAFGPFSPENFDGRFVGPITAQDALTRSRNVPAVAVAAKLTRPSLYDLMKSAGVANLASEKHYGLALTLGGGEVTMEELARMYAMLANGGELRPVSYLACHPKQSINCRPGVPRGPPLGAGRDRSSSMNQENRKSAPGLRPMEVPVGHRGDSIEAAHTASPRLLSEEAAFVTLDMLQSNPRPDTGLPATPPVAWKTGTSWGFRDAWTAGVFGRHVLVVWVGNFDSTSNPAFIGVSAAAPLFFDIVDSLRNEGLVPPHVAPLPPRKLTKIDVCAGSGDLPNAECPQRIKTWYEPGKSPIRVSRLHRRVLIDTRTGEATCTESAHTRSQVVEDWPTDMQRLFREAGMPRRKPPTAAACDGRSSQDAPAPQIVSPLRAVTYTVRLSKPAPITLRAEGTRGKQFWFADEALLGQTEAGETLAWQPPRAGRFVIRVVNEDGAADNREVGVEVVP